MTLGSSLLNSSICQIIAEVIDKTCIIDSLKLKMKSGYLRSRENYHALYSTWLLLE